MSHWCRNAVADTAVCRIGVVTQLPIQRSLDGLTTGQVAAKLAGGLPAAGAAAAKIDPRTPAGALALPGAEGEAPLGPRGCAVA